MNAIQDTFAASIKKLRDHSPFYSENDIRFWLLHDFINACGPLKGLRLATEYPVPRSKGHYDIVILTPEEKLFLVAEVKYYYQSFNIKSFRADLDRLKASNAEHKYFICGILDDKHDAAVKKMAAFEDKTVKTFKFSAPRWSPTSITQSTAT